jgi:hypothetical protein
MKHMNTESTLTFDELVRTFVYETMAGAFAVIDPMAHDEIIGYFETHENAVQAFIEYITKEQIVFQTS